MDVRRSRRVELPHRVAGDRELLLSDDADGGRRGGRQRAYRRAARIRVRLGTLARNLGGVRRRPARHHPCDGGVDRGDDGTRVDCVRAARRTDRAAAAARRVANPRDGVRVSRARGAGRVPVALSLVLSIDRRTRHPARMTNHDRFLSRAAERMQQSAIRKMGTVLASGRDIISFAPGYPAPDTFAWRDFQSIASDLLSSQEAGLLQYGPTRGYRPLLDAILGIQQNRGIAAPLEELLVTTGSARARRHVARAANAQRAVAPA